MLIPYNKDYPSESFYEMVKYHRFEVGTLLCEVIMPYENNKDIVRFFRLLTSEKHNKQKRLILSLDMLDRIFYTDETLIDMRSTDLMEYNLFNVKPYGTNNITEVDSNLEIVAVEKQGMSPDGIALPALLNIVKVLIAKGLVDNKYKLRPRSELLKQNVDLALTIKLVGSGQPEGIFLYRDRFSEVVLTQHELDKLFQIKSFIRTIISYTQERVGEIDKLAFYTSVNYDNIINYMIDLGFIPKNCTNKVAYYPGESTVHAIKLFREKNFETYIKNHMDNVKIVQLKEDGRFHDKANANNLII